MSSQPYCSDLDKAARKAYFKEQKHVAFWDTDRWPYNNVRFLLYDHLDHRQRWLQYAFFRHNGVSHDNAVAWTLVSNNYDRNAYLSLNYLKTHWLRYGVTIWDMIMQKYVKHEGEKYQYDYLRVRTEREDERTYLIEESFQRTLRGLKSAKYGDPDADWLIARWDQYDDPRWDHLLDELDV